MPPSEIAAFGAQFISVSGRQPFEFVDLGQGEADTIWHQLLAIFIIAALACRQVDKLTRDPVAPAKRSEAAMKKACRRTLDDGTPVHSFRILMQDLQTFVRNTCRTSRGAQDAPTFQLTTTPTAKQKHALELISQIKM